MEASFDYRKMLLKSVCQYCNYYNECGANPIYDCAALKKLVWICENLDLCNPYNVGE